MLIVPRRKWPNGRSVRTTSVARAARRRSAAPARSQRRRERTRSGRAARLLAEIAHAGREQREQKRREALSRNALTMFIARCAATTSTPPRARDASQCAPRLRIFWSPAASAPRPAAAIDVGRHRRAVLRADLRGIAHDFRHSPPTLSPSGVLPVSSSSAMSFSDQSPSACWVMFGIQPSPSGVGTAGEALACDDAAKEIARRMTFGAVARPVDQIGAAIPRRVLVGSGCERLAVEEQEFPAAERAADVERKRHVVVATLPCTAGSVFR